MSSSLTAVRADDGERDDALADLVACVMGPVAAVVGVLAL